MTSSMTSHATIGNSTFAQPRSAESTMSSIDGPSDFTENMFEYMKGNKQPTTKQPSRVKSKVKPKAKRHLKQEESGIIIESPSDFSDDLTDFMGDKNDTSSAKGENSDLDGQPDFTANIAGYMGGTKAYSPSALPGVIDARAAISSTSLREESIDHMRGSNAHSPATPFTPVHEKPVLSDSPVTSLPKIALSSREIEANPSHVSKVNENLVINGSSNFTTSLAAFINGTNTGRHASVHTTSSPKITVRPMSSPAKGENFDVNGRADFAADLAKYINEKRKESVAATTTSITKKDNTNETQKAAPAVKTSPMSTQATTAKSSSSISKNDNTNETKKAAPAVKTTSMKVQTTKAIPTSSISQKNDTKEDKKTAPVMKTPPLNKQATRTKSLSKHDDFELEGPSDFTENIVDYINDTKQQSPFMNRSDNKKDRKSESQGPGRAAKTTPPSMLATKTNSSSMHDDSEIDGPSDFTENLVDYMNGTRTYSPQTKTSSSATIAVATNSIEIVNKTSSNGQEEEVRKQIAHLQAQLLQKDQTINGLQDSLTAAENQSFNLESELEQKNTTIDRLQTSLKQSNQQCQGLEFELHQMKLEVDDLQENLNDVIVNTVQHKDHVINRMHHNNVSHLGHIADLRAEIADKDLLLIETVEEVRRPQSETDCELLKDALSHYADDLNIQYDISDGLAAEKKDLEGTISALEKRQAEMEEKQEKREEEWQARAELLLMEIERRGAACMQLWGQLEHPGERDEKGRQKYTYKYTKKGTKGA